MIEFPIDFEEFPLSKLAGLVGEAGYVDGYINVSATRHDWELADVYVYVGPRQSRPEKAPELVAEAIRDYFLGRPGWVGKVDEEHAAHYTSEAIADRRGSMPWMERI